MTLSDETREQIRADAEYEHATRWVVEWHCLRCLHEFETNDRDLWDGFGEEVETDAHCPRCGGDDAVRRGELPVEPPECPECEAPYNHAALAAGDWETSDMECPVCPSCIRAWRDRGAGYFRCTGCGSRILLATPFEGRQHTKRVVQNGDGKRRATITRAPCGEWVREDSLPPGAPAEAKTGGAPLPSALAAVPIAGIDKEVVVGVLVLALWLGALLILWRGQRRNGGPPGKP